MIDTYQICGYEYPIEMDAKLNSIVEFGSNPAKSKFDKWLRDELEGPGTLLKPFPLVLSKQEFEGLCRFYEGTRQLYVSERLEEEFVAKNGGRPRKVKQQILDLNDSDADYEPDTKLIGSVGETCAGACHKMIYRYKPWIRPTGTSPDVLGVLQESDETIFGRLESKASMEQIKPKQLLLEEAWKFFLHCQSATSLGRFHNRGHLMASYISDGGDINQGIVYIHLVCLSVDLGVYQVPKEKIRIPDELFEHSDKPRQEIEDMMALQEHTCDDEKFADLAKQVAIERAIEETGKKRPEPSEVRAILQSVADGVSPERRAAWERAEGTNEDELIEQRLRTKPKKKRKGKKENDPEIGDDRSLPDQFEAEEQ